MNKKKPTILHVINIFFSLSYFGNQFRYFSDKDYEQHLICSPSENLKNYAKIQNIAYLEVEVNRKISLIKDLKALLEISKYIHKNKIDIVVGHTPKGALLAMLASFIMRVPKRIYYRHGLTYETMSGFLRILMKNLDRLTALCSTQVICVSPSVAKISIKEGLNLEKKQMILGGGTCGGIDAKVKFNSRMLVSQKIEFYRKKIQISENSFVIGFCGRLTKDKGIEELVNAFIELSKDKFSDLKLLLVGDFEDRDVLPEDIKNEIRTNKNIIKTGYIFEDIEYYYNLMNVFVLPSYREGFGMVVLEASAMEVPVLTTKATGCVDSIQEGITGRYIENSAESIIEEITKCISETCFSTLGKNGREFVLMNFDNKVLWPIIESKVYN